jgi:hypothetical protein
MQGKGLETERQLSIFSSRKRKEQALIVRGMKWTVLEKNDFEVSEASDGSGLMKKTISISACGCIHHVVSYYKAWARLSQGLKLSLFIIFSLLDERPGFYINPMYDTL